jgi:hypothetical protein
MILAYWTVWPRFKGSGCGMLPKQTVILDQSSWLEEVYLRLCLLQIGGKTCILRLQRSVLLFQRILLLLRLRNALSKYRRRAMLGDQFLNGVEDIHSVKGSRPYGCGRGVNGRARWGESKGVFAVHFSAGCSL